jgi:hypothetical protein
MEKLQVCQPVQNFIDLYGNYLGQRALTELFNIPNFSFHQGSNPTDFERAIMQYADALAFGNLEQLFDKCRALLSLFMERGGDLLYPNFYQRLLFDLLNLRPAPYNRNEMEQFIKSREGTDFDRLSMSFWICDHDKLLIPEDDLKRYLAVYNIPQQNDAMVRYNYMKNWIGFRTERPGFIEGLAAVYEAGGGERLTRPYYPIRYRTKKTFEQKAEKSIRPLLKKIPLLVMEPLDINWKKILSSLEDSPALFLFPTRHHFLQCMQFEAVAKSLSEKNHLIYLLDAYPNHYFWRQFADYEINQGLKPYFFCQNPWIIDRKIDLVAMLEHYLLEGAEQAFKLTPAADNLYDLGLKFSFQFDLNRIGLDNYPSLVEKYSQKHLRNRFVSRPFAPEPNMSVESCSRIGPLHLERRESKNEVECHLLGQLGDPYSEEEALFKTVVQRVGVPKKTKVYCAQRLVKKRLQYPYHPFHVGPMGEESMIKQESIFLNRGIALHVSKGEIGLEESARVAARWLDAQGVDRVVFYESNPLNDLICHLSNVPKKVCFHSLNSQAGKGYSAVIFPSEYSRINCSKELGWMKTKSLVAPFSYSFSAEKSSFPATKTLLGCNEENLVIGTLSPYLVGDLSESFVAFIIKLLEINPSAVWVPFGPIGNIDSWKLAFGRSSVIDRIRPVGHIENPAMALKACDLYLHPFSDAKSTLGLQMAVHSGVPVVAYGGKPVDAIEGVLNLLLDKRVFYGDREDLMWNVNHLLKDAGDREKYLKEQSDFWRIRSCTNEMLAILEREIR